MLAGHPDRHRQKQSEGADIVHEGRENGHSDCEHQDLNGDVSSRPESLGGDQIHQTGMLKPAAKHQDSCHSDDRRMTETRKCLARIDHASQHRSK